MNGLGLNRPVELHPALSPVTTGRGQRFLDPIIQVTPGPAIGVKGKLLAVDTEGPSLLPLSFSLVILPHGHLLR